MFNRSLFCLAVAFSVVFVGCSNDPLAKVHVSGKVTFDGGPCPGPGRVTFSPVEVAEGLPVRPANGKFKADGEYEAMSFRPGDGVVPGKYLVGVACFDPSKLSGAPSNEEYKAASYVSLDFEPKELVIEAGAGSIEFDLDVPQKK